MNEEEKKLEVNTGDTPAPTQEKQDEVKTFTEEEVNKIVQDRINKFYKHYGTESKEEFETLINKGKGYDELNDKLNATSLENANFKEELAFINNNVDPARYDDIKTYFKGKGLEFSPEELVKQMESHPEWIQKQGKVETLSPEKSGDKKAPTEKELAEKVFGMKFIR